MKRHREQGQQTLGRRTAAVAAAIAVAAVVLGYLIGSASDRGRSATHDLPGSTAQQAMPASREGHLAEDLSVEDTAAGEIVRIAAKTTAVKLRGAVRNKRTNAAVADASVDCYVLPSQAEVRPYHTETDKDGSFVVEVWPSGQCDVLVRLTAQGFRDRETRLRITNARRLDIYLEPDDFLTLRIADQNHLPVAGAKANFVAAARGDILLTKAADENGVIEYTLGNLLTGSNHERGIGLYIRADGMCDYISEQMVSRESPLPEEICLHPERVLVGAVNDVKSGGPVPGAAVRAEMAETSRLEDVIKELRGDGYLQTVTDERGAFRLPYIESGGRLRPQLKTFAEGYMQWSEEGYPEAGQSENVVIEIVSVPQTGVNRFQAVGEASEEPIRNTRLHTPLSGRWKGISMWSGCTDGEGFFDVPKYKYWPPPALFLTEDGQYGSGRSRNEGPTGSYRQMEFHKIQRPVLPVRVADELGRPVGDAAVQLVNARYLQHGRSACIAWEWTDTNGECRLDCRELAGRLACIIIDHPEFVTYVSEPSDFTTAQAVAGETTGGEGGLTKIQMTRKSLVQNVRVVDEEGRPRAGMRVEFVLEDGAADRRVKDFLQFETDADGQCDAFLPPFETGTVWVVGRPDTRTAVSYRKIVAAQGVTVVCPAIVPDEWAIAGVVTDIEGTPLEGIDVAARSGPRPGPPTSTTKDGSFKCIVEQGQVCDLIAWGKIQDDTSWYKSAERNGLAAGDRVEIVLERTTGVMVHVMGRGSGFGWSEVWLETEDGTRVPYERKRDGGERQYFYGVPDSVQLKAMVRRDDGVILSSELIQLEPGKGRTLEIIDESYWYK